MNTAQLIRYTRDLLDVSEADAVDPLPWTEAELLRYVNRELLQQYANAVWNDPSWFLVEKDGNELGINWTSIGDAKYEGLLPDWVHTVQRVFLGSDEVDLAYANTRRATRLAKTADYFGDQGSGHWMFGGRDRIVLHENPLGKTVRFWVTKLPPELLRFTASGGTISTITVDVTTAPILGEWVARPGEYIGAIVEVSSAGGTPPQGELRTVTGFTGTYPNFTFTVNEPFTAVVGSGDTIEMAPALREVDHELIAYGAAIRALDRKGAANQRLVLADTYQVLYAQFIRSVTKRQTQTSGKSVVPSRE